MYPDSTVHTNLKKISDSKVSTLESGSKSFRIRKSDSPDACGRKAYPQKKSIRIQKYLDTCYKDKIYRRKICIFCHDNKDRLSPSLSANTIMAKPTNQFQRTRDITSSPDKHYSLDSEENFRSGCRNVSHQQQFFSELPSPGRSHYTNYYFIVVTAVFYKLCRDRGMVSVCFIYCFHQG